MDVTIHLGWPIRILLIRSWAIHSHGGEVGRAESNVDLSLSLQSHCDATKSERLGVCERHLLTRQAPEFLPDDADGRQRLFSLYYLHDIHIV